MSMAAVSLILLLILLSSHFARLLADAATGRLDAGVLFSVVGFMALRFLEVVLSLGLFIGIMFSYGRLYVESEMTVLSACGVSEKRLLSYTLLIALPVAIAVGGISLYLSPIGYKATHKIIAEQRNRTDFEAILPARFNRSDEGQSISYAGAVSEDKKQLIDVFMAHLNSEVEDKKPEILISKTGETKIVDTLGQKFLILKDGVRYVGEPGTGNYEIVEFEQYLQLLPEPNYRLAKQKETAGMSLQELYVDPSYEALVTLHWRFSLPFLVIVVAFLAVPLSRAQPRSDRYSKIIPAVLVYVLYVFLLQFVRGQAEKDSGISPMYLWLVHGTFLSLGLTLFNGPTLKRMLNPFGRSLKSAA